MLQATWQGLWHRPCLSIAIILLAVSRLLQAFSRTCFMALLAREMAGNHLSLFSSTTAERRELRQVMDGPVRQEAGRSTGHDLATCNQQGRFI